MKKYIFKTNVTMKDYNNKKWWIDDRSGKWTAQYIDLWVDILTVIDTEF